MHCHNTHAFEMFQLSCTWNKSFFDELLHEQSQSERNISVFW
jgi:hypothetical protein